MAQWSGKWSPFTRSKCLSAQCGFGNYGGLWKKDRRLDDGRPATYTELFGILTFHLGRWSEQFCFKDEGITCTVQSHYGSIRLVISVYLPEIHLLPGKLNTAAKNLPFQNERIVFQPSFFRGYVKLRAGAVPNKNSTIQCRYIYQSHGSYGKQNLPIVDGTDPFQKYSQMGSSPQGSELTLEKYLRNHHLDWKWDVWFQ